jgi:hypothetical protein
MPCHEAVGSPPMIGVIYAHISKLAEYLKEA